MEKKLEKLEQNKIIISDLQLKNSIKAHKNFINSISVFPSGNIVSVSADKSIKIYDNNFHVLQKIENAHTEAIVYVDILDENNFITSANNIKFWNKKDNLFSEKNVIENAHNDEIRKIIHFSNYNLISCSRDKTVKLWEINNNKYENITTLVHSNNVSSILLLEDKKILISSGLDGTYFWNTINYEKLFYIKETFCGWNEGIKNIDDNRIIVKGKDSNLLKIISISQKEVIAEIENYFQCNAIGLIKEKELLLIGGKNKSIKIYRYDTFECIQIINNAHEDDIRGFTLLNNKTICSFSKDKNIKIWKFS
jgi:WD40 repeat protein